MEPEIKKVLVPIDFSDYSKAALRYAVSFAKMFKAEMILVYVVEPVIYPPDFSMGQIAIPSVNTEWDVKAKEELNKLASNEIPKERPIIWVKYNTGTSNFAATVSPAFVCFASYCL